MDVFYDCPSLAERFTNTLLQGQNIVFFTLPEYIQKVVITSVRTLLVKIIKP